MAGGTFSSSGSFDNTFAFLKAMEDANLFAGLESIAQAGVSALSSMTPQETGLAASSWGYEIEDNGKTVSIYWTNSDIEGGANVAILLQYGHATGTGGYVSGYDYINPAIQPIFDQLAEDLWRKVTNA